MFSQNSKPVWLGKTFFKDGRTADEAAAASFLVSWKKVWSIFHFCSFSLLFSLVLGRCSLLFSQNDVTSKLSRPECITPNVPKNVTTLFPSFLRELDGTVIFFMNLSRANPQPDLLPSRRHRQYEGQYLVKMVQRKWQSGDDKKKTRDFFLISIYFVGGKSGTAFSGSNILSLREEIWNIGGIFTVYVPIVETQGGNPVGISLSRSQRIELEMISKQIDSLIHSVLPFQKHETCEAKWPRLRWEKIRIFIAFVWPRTNR